MKTIYIVEYKYQTSDGQFSSHINQTGWVGLEECQKWCARNGVKSLTHDMIYHWVEGGDNWYIIHLIEVNEKEEK